MKKVFCFCTLLALLFALPVQADTITYNGTVSPSMLDNGSPGSLPTDLPMFNVTGATLTGVQITLNLEATPFAEPFNASFSPATFTSSDWASCDFNPAVNTWVLSQGSDSWNLAVPTVSTGMIYGTGQTIAPFSGLMLVGSTSAPVNFTGNAGLANLAEYIGAGTLSFGTAGTGTYTIYDGPLSAGGGANLTGTASVTYTYTPEPATMVLLGLGGLLLRRRK